MTIDHVVVDGSNIATEGRTAPSLVQLDEAVRAFLDEYGGELKLTVVVDATFGHRIDQSEREAFDAGIVNGELVAPPAGAIGRGDAFVLQIADKTGATVFSNDSFQEFHGDYDWLFDEGRLIGGKPVPAVGWVFVTRTPVRGPTSRRATRGKQVAKGSGAKLGPPPVPKAPPPRPAKGDPESEPTPAKARGKGRSKAKAKATAKSQSPKAASPDEPATTSAAEDGGRRRGRRRRSGAGTAQEPLNEPMVFLGFVAEHPVGSEVEATVDRFSSHGAYLVSPEGAQCYLALKAMADPAPTKARDQVTLGETDRYIVTGFDSVRRGIDVAVPAMAATVIDTEANDPQRPPGGPDQPDQPEEDQPMATKKATTKKKAVAKKAPAKKTTVKKAAAKKAPAKKTTAKKATTAKKTTAKKATAKKATTAKKAPAKKATVKKTAARKATR